MPLWRCPHCGTPQAETSRCWVCRRSTTSCVTCRHFRRGVAGGLGLCGLDPRRIALRGDEMRACWSATDMAPDAPARDPQPMGVVAAPGLAAGGPGTRGRTFVPVDADAPVSAPGVPEAAHRWSLWSDLEA